MADGEGNPYPVDELRLGFELRRTTERCNRLEVEIKELKHNNYILEALLTRQRDTQADILKTLHANLDEGSSKIQEQDGLITKLREQLERQQETFERSLEEDGAAHERKVAELQLKIDHLQAALDELSAFRMDKERIEAELEGLKVTMEDLKTFHDKELSAVERKKSIELSEIKNAMLAKIDATRDILQRKTRERVSDATKKAILENDQMMNDLQFQCKETERLIARNKTLSEENAKLRRHLTVHKDLENELVRRSHLQQRLLKKFNEQAAEAQDQRETPKAAATPDGGGQASPGRAEALARELETARAALQRIKADFGRYRKDHAAAAGLQDWGARETAAALQELRSRQDLEQVLAPDASGRFGRLSRRQREKFLVALFETLSASACRTVPLNAAQPKRDGGLSRSASSPALPPIRGSPAPAPLESLGAAAPADLRQLLRSLAISTGMSELSQEDLAAVLTEERAIQTDPPDDPGGDAGSLAYTPELKSVAAARVPLGRYRPSKLRI